MKVADVEFANTVEEAFLQTGSLLVDQEVYFSKIRWNEVASSCI
jgi:hypothetical protein